MMPLQRQPWTILLIDDTLANLKLAVELLEAYSFVVLTARDGESGLERAALARPDLILLDVNLPGIDGFEVCRRLKANPATALIPVILMTVLSDTQDKVRGLEAGAVDYVTKPFEAVELLARVRTHLALRTLQSDLEALVAERTAALEAEIEQRRQAEEEKSQLLHTLRQLLDASLATQKQHSQALSSERLTLEQLGSCLTALYHHSPQSATSAQLFGQAHELLDSLQNQLAHEASAERERAVAQPINPLEALSAREQEVVQLIVEGRTTAEIADSLAIERATVSTYRKRIMQKLEVNDLPALIKLFFAYQM